MVAPEVAPDVLLPELEDRETLEELRVVAARIALEELLTPPTEAPPPAEPPPMEALDPPEEEDPPPAALEVTDPAKELGVLPPLELLDPLLEEEDPPPPPLLDPPLDDPPPPRLRPMKAPPPPPKLRLPRSWGPRMVTKVSGPVVPVRRNVCISFPPLTEDVLMAVVRARLAATASSAKCFWYNQ